MPGPTAIRAERQNGGLHATKKAMLEFGDWLNHTTIEEVPVERASHG